MTAAATTKPLDIAALRQCFPVLAQKVRDDKPLVYMDNAATTLKPQSVVDAVSAHYLLGAANVHRGVHALSEDATRLFDAAREKVRAFINAKESAEVIFTSGTTGGINLVAHSFGSLFKAGDEVLISHMEHHSNIVPWQLLAQRQGIVLKVAPINDAGELLLPEFEQMLTPRTRLVSVVAVSNALGTINPIEKIIAMAHSRDIPVLLDAAQAVAHKTIDVQKLDVDFLAFSSHKLFGPTGVGVLYGRRSLLERMPPFLSGGDMIRSVSFAGTTFAELPAKFEAGTPHIAGVIGLGAAVDFVQELGLERIAAAEQALLAYGTERLARIKDLTPIGTAAHKTSILAFVLKDIHPHDIGTLLDQEGVAIRAGHHCTQPLMQRFGLPATARASLAFYNTTAEIDVLVEAIEKTQRLFA